MFSTARLLKMGCPSGIRCIVPFRKRGYRERTTNISHFVSCLSGSWATGSRTTNHSHVALLGDVVKCLCESGAAGSGTTKISYVAECLSGSEAAGSGTTTNISYVAECRSGSKAAGSGTTTNISYVAECLSGSKAAGSGTTIISYVTLCLSGSEAAGSGITTNCIKWNAGNGKNENKWNVASGKNKLSAMRCIKKIFLNSIAINIPLNFEMARTWSFAPVTLCAFGVLFFIVTTLLLQSNICRNAQSKIWLAGVPDSILVGQRSKIVSSMVTV
ncbi:hypothetical protein B0H13DRAFT_1920852 [Mycena leptocephala]|nr:hypothetical protein B0H13DRAFT_1920852 [Mycena leptocephala]